VLSPAKEAVGFVIKKDAKGIRMGNMVTTVRKFLNDNAEKGIFGLFAAGERLTVEKMH